MAPAEATGRVLSGRYALGELVGIGGMAEVYAARDQVLGRRVAVKIPRPQFAADPAWVKRFLTEARLAAQLNHPNIVSVFDFAVDGVPYLVMEHVLGLTVTQYVAERGPLPLEEALRLTRQIADALAAAHRRGVLHRDVKPGNVLLHPEAGAKLADFGIAAVGGHVGEEEVVWGTPAYVAPEVVRRAPPRPVSDVYAAGAVLYFMLTGRPPAPGDAPGASRFCPHLPPEVDALLARTLDPDPERRLHSADALRHALDVIEAQAGTPTRVVGDRQPRVRWALPVLPPPISHLPRLARVLALGSLLVMTAWWATRAVAQPVAPPAVAASVSSAAHAASASPTSAPARPSPTAPAPTNLLFNPGLASSGRPPEGWSLSTFKGHAPFYVYEPGGPGGRLVGLGSRQPIDAAWIGRDIPLAAGRQVVVRGFIRTAGVPENGPGASLHFPCHAADRQRVQEFATPPVKGTTDWSPVEARLTVPPGTAFCYLQLRLGEESRPTTGSAEFSAPEVIG